MRISYWSSDVCSSDLDRDLHAEILEPALPIGAAGAALRAGAHDLAVEIGNGLDAGPGQSRNLERRDVHREQRAQFLVFRARLEVELAGPRLEGRAHGGQADVDAVGVNENQVLVRTLGLLGRGGDTDRTEERREGKEWCVSVRIRGW